MKVNKLLILIVVGVMFFLLVVCSSSKFVSGSDIMDSVSVSSKVVLKKNFMMKK